MVGDTGKTPPLIASKIECQLEKVLLESDRRLDACWKDEKTLNKYLQTLETKLPDQTWYGSE